MPIYSIEITNISPSPELMADPERFASILLDRAMLVFAPDGKGFMAVRRGMGTDAVACRELPFRGKVRSVYMLASTPPEAYADLSSEEVL